MGNQSAGGASRGSLRAALERRRPELEEAIELRIFAIPDSVDADPVYREGQRASVSIGLDYALAALEAGEERAAPPPPALLAQARMAARMGIGLDTLLRRYLAGYAAVGDVLIQEVDDGLLEGASLRPLLRGHMVVLDRLLSAVSQEYARENQNRVVSTEQRRADRIERLLAGEPLDVSEFGYEFDGRHTGLVAVGADIATPIRQAAASLDRRLLLVRPAENVVWAWFGGTAATESKSILATLKPTVRPGVFYALGEPAAGPQGWRLTHRQAKAAFFAAQRGERQSVRYADVSLLTAVIQDEVLSRSLRQIYLTPLSADPERGETLRQTLRAYFAAARNVSSTAAALGVKRHTVTNRLREAEERIGHSIDSHAAEIETVLRLQEMEEGETGR